MSAWRTRRCFGTPNDARAPSSSRSWLSPRRDAFERFIESRFRPRISVEFRGELRSLEQVFYKWMRCELVRDGRLPVDLRFKDDAEPGELSVRAGGAPNYVLLVSPGWFDQLIAWALSSRPSHLLSGSLRVSWR